MSDIEQPSPSDLAAAYALGALEPEEARAFERLLAESESLRREVADYREVGAMLALGAEAPALDASLRQRVIAHAAGTGARVLPIGTARFGRPTWPLWTAL